MDKWLDEQQKGGQLVSAATEDTATPSECFLPRSASTRIVDQISIAVDIYFLILKGSDSKIGTVIQLRHYVILIQVPLSSHTSSLSMLAMSAFRITRWLLTLQHHTITRMKDSQSRVSRNKLFQWVLHSTTPLLASHWPRLGHWSIIRLDKEKQTLHNWHRTVLYGWRIEIDSSIPTWPNGQNEDSVYLEEEEMTITCSYLPSSLTACLQQILKSQQALKSFNKSLNNNYVAGTILPPWATSENKI